MRKTFPLFILMPLILSSCSKKDTFLERMVFGCETLFELKAYNAEASSLDKMLDEINKYSELFDAFNTYKNTTNIASINQTNEEVILEKDLYDALKIADEYFKKTNGYFNPYLGELTFAYKDAFSKNIIPSENEINNGLSHLKTFKFEFNDEKMSVKRVGDSKIDLGAFAKGYLIDKVNEIAKENGVDFYMISGGSSSNYFTEKPKGESYRVGIKYLNKKYLELKNTSLGISSIYEQIVEVDGKKYSHIINPFTGKPAMDYAFSIVVDESATLTDVFSTVLMTVNNVSEIEEMAQKFDFSYMLFDEKDNIISKTSDLNLKSY